MIRNGGVLGALQSVSQTNSTGIYDLHDQLIHNEEGNWEPTLKFISISNIGNVLENDLISHTVSFSGLKADETIYYRIVHGTTNTTVDLFFDTGSFTALESSQQGLLTYNTRFVGDPDKPLKTYKIRLFRGALDGELLFETGDITIIKPTLGGLFFSPSTVNEFSSPNTSLYGYLNNVGTVSSVSHYYSFLGGSAYFGVGTSNDFDTSPFSSILKLPSSNFPRDLTVKDDWFTEGTETLLATLRFQTNVSGVYYNAWGNTTLTINDTSPTPNIIITPSAFSVDEGNTITFSVRDYEVGEGVLYWSVSGTNVNAANVNASDFAQGNTGSFTMTSGNGNITLNISTDANTTEGESFILSVRRDSTSGTILANSASITIVDSAAPVGQDITSQFVEISNTHIDSDVYMGSTADYNGPYDVTEIQTDFSGGTGRVYIGFKVTSATTFYSDLPVAGVQVLSSDKSTLLHSWIFDDFFGGSGSGWTTTTAGVGSSSTVGQFAVTPAGASVQTYLSISSGSSANRFNWATSTGSSYTGAADGISSSYRTNIMPAGSSAINQSSGTYYAYVETSGMVRYTCHVMRSPSVIISGGSWIRIAHAVTAPSTNRQDVDDCLYVGVY